MEGTELAFRDLRRKTHDSSDDCETTESSHQVADEVDSEILVESVRGAVGCRRDSHRNHGLFHGRKVGADKSEMQSLNSIGIQCEELVLTSESCWMATRIREETRWLAE